MKVLALGVKFIYDTKQNLTERLYLIFSVLSNQTSAGCGILIPADDSVRLLSAFVEGMELSDLYQTYCKIKKNQPTPR